MIESKTGNVYIFIMAISTFQIFGVVSPLGEDLNFFSLLGSDIQRNSEHKTQQIKLCLVRAVKRYLNEKNINTWARNANDFKI